MSQEGPKKTFVKFTNFDDKHRQKPRDGQTPKHRQSARYKGKKNYLEKTLPSQNHSQTGNTNVKQERQQKYERQQNSISAMISCFTSIKISEKVEELVKAFPKFFTNISHYPEKDHSENLNDSVIMNTRKPHNEASNFTKNQTVVQTMLEQSDDPDWNTGSEDDFTLESKQIDQELKKRVEQNLNEITSKRKDELKRHEKQFLQDHFRNRKKMEEQGELESNFRIAPNEDIKNQKKIQKIQKNQKTILEKVQEKKEEPKSKQVKFQGPEKSEAFFANWLGLDKSQDKNCWIQKIEKDDENFEDFQGQDGEDEMMFDLADQKSNQTSSDQDDAFVDQDSHVIHKKGNDHGKKNTENTDFQSSQHAGTGTVLINSYIFSNIVERIGFPPASCIWVISDRNDRYKVSTEYMDKFYRQQKIYQNFPFISLNHSDFVHNNDVNTERGFERLKKMHERKIRAQNKQKQGDDRKPYSYKEKQNYDQSQNQNQNQNNYIHKKR